MNAFAKRKVDTTGPRVSVNERCVGCEECVIRCSTQALSMDPVKWLPVADSRLCAGCRQCERVCPVGGITVEGPAIVAERSRLLAKPGPAIPGDVSEVRPGFQSFEEAIREAERCLNCPDPTCVRGCPAHNDIPGFIAAVKKMDLGEAQTVLARTNCLPDVCSRVCDWASQCEGSCAWALAGKEAVAIGKLERFVTDNSAIPPVRRSSKPRHDLSTGIIGSGPAGIAAAFELVSAGASVTIYDRDIMLGGVMRWGIPSFVLPDAVLERPLKALVEAGVDIEAGSPVRPEGMLDLLKKHDAVIVSVGATVPERPDIPGIDLNGVMDATAFLRRAKFALNNGVLFSDLKGAVVAVLGGSQTGLDVARSVLRLGGQPIIIQRREERFSRARPDEIAEAKSEGVEFRFSTNIARLEGQEGELRTAVLVRTRQKGAAAPIKPVKRTESSLVVRMVVLATGYGLDPSFTPVFRKLPLRAPSIDRSLPDLRWVASGVLSGQGVAGRLAWETEYALQMSKLPQRGSVWVIGDALTGPSTVVASMAEGKLAARGILDRFVGE